MILTICRTCECLCLTWGRHMKLPGTPTLVMAVVCSAFDSLLRGGLDRRWIPPKYPVGQIGFIPPPLFGQIYWPIIPPPKIKIKPSKMVLGKLLPFSKWQQFAQNRRQNICCCCITASCFVLLLLCGYQSHTSHTQSAL